jgi:leucyl aminopeptidase
MDWFTAHLDNNRRIEFNASEHRHFDHGYAVTSHSSQGLTAERVLVNMDTEVHPDLVNSRFAYVSVSRASHEAHIYTNDAESLGKTLSRDANKTSAVDFTRALSNAPQQSLTPQELTVNSFGACALRKLLLVPKNTVSAIPSAKGRFMMKNDAVCRVCGVTH